MNARKRPPVDRKAYRIPEEAAEALGIGVTHFKAYVLPDLKTVRRGAVRIVSGRELDRWLESSETDY